MFVSQPPLLSFVQSTMRITSEVLSVVLILMVNSIKSCQAQHQEYKSIADYVDNLTHDDSSREVLILIADGQNDLANEVLQKIMNEGRMSVTIANSHFPISKIV